MRRLVVVLLVLVGLGAAAAAAGWWWLERQLDAPGPRAEATRIHVEPGQGLRSVLRELAQEGLIADPRPVEIWARLTGQVTSVRAGSYEIPAGATVREILEQLEAGRIVLESLTIAEGRTFAEFRRALESHPRVRQTLRGRSDAEVMRALGAEGTHPEGQFFPDTYRFADGATDVEILRLARAEMQRRLEAAWSRRQDGLPLRSAYEALILASIVEKETALESERPRIAGVFTTRLRRGMRLQTDPTVIYGLGASYDGDIRARDLRTDTPYNTYTRAGLPPTPIALPGQGALDAVVAPLETGEIFFVATGEPDGSHFFSKDYAEHRRGIERMLARQRERARAESGAASAAGGQR